MPPEDNKDYQILGFGLDELLKRSKRFATILEAILETVVEDAYTDSDKIKIIKQIVTSSAIKSGKD